MNKLIPFLVLLANLSHAASNFGGYQPYGDLHWKAPVASVAALPATGNVVGDTRVEMTSFGVYVWTGSAWTTSSGGGSGTVTSVSVVSANGFAGTVATATTTPAITLSTTVTGLLQGNGTAISAATTGNLTDAGTDGITVTAGTGAVLGSGTSLSQHVADGTHNGYLSSSDWTTFNNKQAAGSYLTALTGDGTASGPGSAALTLATVNANVGSFGDASHVGAFTVNGKGLVTAASSTSIQIAESQVTNLVSDLAGKQAAGNYITGLTGDVSASGPGSVAATLATVNVSPGTYTNATITVNGKGLVTSASSGTTSAPSYNPLTKTAGYALVAGDVVAADASSASFTLTLPDATTNAGKPILVVRKDSTVSTLVTIACAGSDTFNGGDTTMILVDQNDSVQLISIGAIWYVF